MKKTIIIITSIILICILFVGCNNENTAINTGKELNKNLSILSNTVSRLDSIDNEYLVNNDLYKINKTQTTSTIPTKHKSSIYKLANTTNVIEEDNSLNNTLKEEITKEIIDRLYCDNDGNCKICKQTFLCNEDGICKNCNQTIICDKNGNCTECNSPLIIDNNNCSSCNTNCISKDIKFKPTEENNLLLQKISLDNKNILEEIKTPETNTINNVIDNKYENSDNSLVQQDKNNNTTNQPLKIIYYTEESFSPDILKYKPRFANNLNYSSVNENIDRYINKVQKLYTMTADVVEANNELGNYKISILNNIDDTKELNNCIINGTCIPNNNQILALNNYIADIRNTINNLRNCNGNLINEINKISTYNTGINQSIDITNSNYLRILNQIDTRISYHENALATLEQIKYLLEDAKNNTNNNINIEDLNNSNTNDIITNTTDTNQNINNDLSSDELNDNILNNQNSDLIIDKNNNLSEDNNTPSNEQNSTTDNSLDNNQTNSNVIESEDNKLDEDQLKNNNFDTESNSEELSTVDSEKYNETNSNTNSDKPDNTNTDITKNNLTNNDNISEDNNIENIENSDTQNSDEINNTNKEMKPTILDSYDDNNLSNVDTYSDNESSDKIISDNTNNNDDTLTNENNIDSNNNINTKITDNTTNNQDNLDIVSNDTNTNNTNTPSMVGNNNVNSNINGIINENNLDDSFGNNNYHYDEEGNLYNNTNGFDTNSNHNVNYDENNVNTYQYNTLIDSINRGTINNGINNL